MNLPFTPVFSVSLPFHEGKWKQYTFFYKKVVNKKARATEAKKESLGRQGSYHKKVPKYDFSIPWPQNHLYCFQSSKYSHFQW